MLKKKKKDLRPIHKGYHGDKKYYRNSGLSIRMKESKMYSGIVGSEGTGGEETEMKLVRRTEASSM